MFEVALYTAGGSLDFVRRHMAIINELERLRRELSLGIVDVLDFGGGHSPLADFIRLYGLTENYSLTVADIDSEAITAARVVAPLVAKSLLAQDGSLPFTDASFDIVVSSDVFEHIPHSRREDWAHELQRVARHAQVHNVPCDGEQFASSQADRSYQTWHIEQFGTPEPWTAEHLANGCPTIDELRALFAGSNIYGLANVDQWLSIMKLEGTRPSHVSRFLRGRAYAAKGQFRDRDGPYKAAFVTWRRADGRRAEDSAPGF
jgi:SAM-dependent methyltransferase